MDLTICRRCGRKMRSEQHGDNATEIFIDEHIEQFHKEEYQQYKKQMTKDNTMKEFYKDLEMGQRYAHIRALEVFDNSRDAMIKEMLKRRPTGGLYQIVLMLAEQVAHEEMAGAFDSVTDIVLDELFKAMPHKEGKTAENFKQDLKDELRGKMTIKEMIEKSGFSDGIRKLIRSSL